jgi:transposase
MKPGKKYRPGPAPDRNKVARLPQKVRDAVARDLILGKKSMYQAAKDLGVTAPTVARFINAYSEEDRLRIMSSALEAKKIKEGTDVAEFVNELGDDISSDLKWVLRELKALLEDAKGDDEKALQLGALKELRQSLMAVADITGKLSRKVEVSFELHESPAFLELRTVMLRVLENHPEAKADFLNEMGALKVVGSS